MTYDMFRLEPHERLAYVDPDQCPIITFGRTQDWMVKTEDPRHPGCVLPPPQVACIQFWTTAPDADGDAIYIRLRLTDDVKRQLEEHGIC